MQIKLRTLHFHLDVHNFAVAQKHYTLKPTTTSTHISFKYINQNSINKQLNNKNNIQHNINGLLKLKKKKLKSDLHQSIINTQNESMS
jgi:hypothetical protein